METFIRKTLRYWYIPLVLGVLFIGLGIRVFSTPAETFLALALLFSIGFIVSGLLETLYALSNRKMLTGWGWYLAGGIVTFLLGLHLVLRPELSVLVLSLYIGFWLTLRSVMCISTSLELKEYGLKNWGWVLVLGILGVLFSFILLWNPVITGITLAFWTGSGLVVFGIFNILVSFSLKSTKRQFKDIENHFDVK